TVSGFTEVAEVARRARTSAWWWSSLSCRSLWSRFISLSSRPALLACGPSQGQQERAVGLGVHVMRQARSHHEELALRNVYGVLREPQADVPRQGLHRRGDIGVMLGDRLSMLERDDDDAEVRGPDQRPRGLSFAKVGLLGT